MNLNTTKPVIIGIDHGYGNIKTAHAIFKSGVTAYDKEPTFTRNMLTYDGRYYIIGTSTRSLPPRRCTIRIITS